MGRRCRSRSSSQDRAADRPWSDWRSTPPPLTAIHQAEVVHLDFKPGNVLLGPDGPVVNDFGISRALDLSVSHDTSRPMGTPGYMAPEMITGGEVGPAADLFAWGATMVYAATGQRAFNGDSGALVVRATLHSDPDLSRFDERLRGLVQACLSKDPAMRPTAAQVVERLRGTAAPVVTARRRSWAPFGAVAAAAVITGGVGYVIMTPETTQADRDVASRASRSAPFSLMSTPSPVSSVSPTATQRRTPKVKVTAKTDSPSTPKASDPQTTPKPSIEPSAKPSVKPSAQPTPETRKSTPPATEKPSQEPPRTLGTVDSAEITEYCEKQGYLMVQDNSDGTFTCSLPAWNAPENTPGTMVVTWTDACRRKFPNARNVVAEGQTCKGN